ncbi:hypothetical protein A4A49_55045 [Nicotiana attenuata]|uniref:Chromo domain-containing protein n=1 Tax=Nicotiana attenuata TaxID=49451 RepID=A0A314KK52_NICAT|nr:hypothetical protein A4A49_55045 [Nicotiana attenuata]
MVDTGATHTFVSANLVHKYGLSVSKCPSYMKTVNAKAQAIVGMAYNVPMSVGNWKGKVNLMVIPSEDFEVILGINFMQKNRFVPMPHLDGVMIMHETTPSFVKVVHPYGKEETQRKASLVSAMMVEKGLKRGDDTFLAAMVEVKPDVKVDVPDCIWKKIDSRVRHRALVSRYDGPFEVAEKVGEIAYRLKLPERMKIHPTFHVSYLRPYVEDPEDPDMHKIKRAPPEVRTQLEEEIEKILDHRVLGMHKKNRWTEFLIQWKGKPEADATWEKGVSL